MPVQPRAWLRKRRGAREAQPGTGWKDGKESRKGDWKKEVAKAMWGTGQRQERCGQRELTKITLTEQTEVDTKSQSRREKEKKRKLKRIWNGSNKEKKKRKNKGEQLQGAMRWG